MDITGFKQQAAEKAVEYVASGMVVGLGGGSTALFAIKRLGHLLQTGQLKDVLGVPCSLRVERDARQSGVPLTTLDEHPVVDLTIDGADEVDPNLNLIKGGGGALLREKIVAQASRREVIVVDESKLSPALGTRWAVPVEVLDFGLQTQVSFLRALGGEATLRLRGDGTPYRTDQGNLILDVSFGPIAEPAALAAKLSERAGIVEHGLFLGLASEVLVAGPGGVRRLLPPG